MDDTQEDEYTDTLNGMLRFMQDKGDVAIEEVIAMIEYECEDGNVSTDTLRQFAAALEELAENTETLGEAIAARIA